MKIDNRWEAFAKSGSVFDYLEYSNNKAIIGDNANATENQGVNNQGANCGGERPSGDAPH